MHTQTKTFITVLTAAFCFALWTGDVGAQDDESLSKQLANPLAAMISVPTQINYDDGLGAREDGSIWQINVQPVLPFQLNTEWNLITRTIIPLIQQEDIGPKGTKDSGLGDIVESLFFSPIQPTASGWIWGAGPVFLFPTATDDALGSDQWALGPTFVALKQEGTWTVGILANHLWTISGEKDLSDIDESQHGAFVTLATQRGASISNEINASYVEPWVSYGAPWGTTLSMSVESSYDWNESAWLIPVVFTADHLFEEAPIPFSIGAAARYWAEAPDGGPDGWAGRFQFTFLFAK